MKQPCELTAATVSAYLDNELSATESLAFERHLQRCEQRLEMPVFVGVTAIDEIAGHEHRIGSR